MRKNRTKQIDVGGVPIGGGADVSIQSMTTTSTADTEATVRQIQALASAGCDIVRVAVPDSDAAFAIAEIKERISIPLVADIHFDYRLALESVAAGADKIRINPGNIGGEERVRDVAAACRKKGVPIRVGANGGSLSKTILDKHGGPTADAICESALQSIALLNRFDVDDICVSLKSSNVRETVEANRRFSELDGHPLHIGVTETGNKSDGIIKSAVGIGALLLDGIGDTLRVSLTADPVEEVRAGLSILKAVGLRREGIELISCPTCGRCGVDLISMAERVHSELAHIKTPLKVAVMGCAVNGPGEAREADVGIACGKGEGLLFRRGEVVAKVAEDELIPALLRLVDEMLRGARE
ncbi:flavodoxin-dependent (E)-4-hydroxy-3-methylbut-2-enyl-diphosphate synthase [Oscillospiraceae bacterium OttesenSCG-928-G22]|nr:flavodoxin-dependent (E)-4-hydroxy-3-methylbut-2-enyl-diphosphate synthase [Oscillospiraceae bacterium OttesenSCG-928-G22]